MSGIGRSMRMLVTSDWHPDKRTLNFPRFEDVEQAVEQVVDVAIREKVDVFTFLGDLCDPDAGPIVLRCAALALHVDRRLRDAGITRRYVAGNHDVFEDGSGMTSLEPLKAYGAEVFDRVCHFEEEGTGLEFLVLPFTAVSHPYDVEEFARATMHSVETSTAQSRLVVLGHLHVKGIVPGEETREMGRGRDLWFPREVFRGKEERVMMFNGHYHEAQTHDGVHVPGSLCRFTFGEEKNRPSFLLVDL